MTSEGYLRHHVLPGLAIALGVVMIVHGIGEYLLQDGRTEYETLMGSIFCGGGAAMGGVGTAGLLMANR